MTSTLRYSTDALKDRTRLGLKSRFRENQVAGGLRMILAGKQQGARRYRLERAN
jgi:hypothetical protein